jgi:hypothetical protein
VASHALLMSMLGLRSTVGQTAGSETSLTLGGSPGIVDALTLAVSRRLAAREVPQIFQELIEIVRSGRNGHTPRWDHGTLPCPVDR